MTRVGILYDGFTLPPKEGVSQRLYELITRLSKRSDIEPILYTDDRGWATKTALDNLGVRYHMLPWSFRYGNDVDAFAELLKKDSPDVLHTAGSHLAILQYAAYLGRRCATPLIGDMHDIYKNLLTSLDDTKEAIQAAELRQKLCVRLCDGIIAMSSFDIPALYEYGAQKDRLFYIPNGVTMQPIDSLHTAQRNALFIGNMFYEPNKRAAIRIAERIAPLVPEQQFILVGKAPADAIAIFAQQSNVQYLGEIDDLRQACVMAGIGLAPLQEGSGMKLKVMTYGSYGITVVASKEAMAGYAETDSIMRAESDQEYADAIRRLTADPDALIQRQRATYEYIGQHYDWDVLIHHEADAFRTIASLPKIQAQPLRAELPAAESIVYAAESIGLPLWMQEERV